MKNILVPTDFSSGARNAMKFAIKLGQKTGARLIFFHSSYFDEASSTGGLTTYEEELKSAKANAEKKLRAEAEKTMKELRVQPARVRHTFSVEFSASASDSMLAAAKKTKADLIVMGTHGASGIKKILFGSNTSRLIASALFPVLALPLRYKDYQVKQIIYCTDLEQITRELKQVRHFEKKLGAKIRILNINYGWAISEKELALIKKLEKGKFTFERIRIPIEISLEKELKRYMRGRKHAILCIFHKKKNALAGFLFGEKTQGLVKELKFPLLAIPK